MMKLSGRERNVISLAI